MTNKAIFIDKDFSDIGLKLWKTLPANQKKLFSPSKTMAQRFNNLSTALYDRNYRGLFLYSYLFPLMHPSSAEHGHFEFVYIATECLRFNYKPLMSKIEDIITERDYYKIHNELLDTKQNTPSKQLFYIASILEKHGI